MTVIEGLNYGRSMPRYDRRGRRILSRAEWEQLPRRRRLRDVLLGWNPPKNEAELFPPFR